MTEMTTERAIHPQAFPEQVKFTYAHQGQSWFRRQLIRSVEKASGSGHFRQLYCDWVAKGAVGNPFEDAVHRLKFRIELAGTPLGEVTRKGGLLLVANHPFGIADGLAMGWLATKMRREVRILTHSLLCTVPEFRSHLLPVDFGETFDARRKTASTRRQATDLLAEGGAVVIFPGGSVATSNRPFSRPAAELPWHPFVARLAITQGTTVVPVYFHGQNSLWFQLASHVSYPLRIALLFHETRRRMGSELSMTIGEPLTSDDLGALPRSDIAGALRQDCLNLGSANSTEEFHWPGHIRW